MRGLTKLKKSFSLEGFLDFKLLDNGFIVVFITTEMCCAEVLLHGAHLISFKPNEEEDLLWLSEDAVFGTDNAVRGGIPICWPWFGKDPEGIGPSHGFARISQWEVEHTELLKDQRVKLVLSLPNKCNDSRFNNVNAKIIFIFGKSLEIELVTENRSKNPVKITEALHAYFRVKDISDSIVKGFDGCFYFDMTSKKWFEEQFFGITIAGECDRVYKKENGSVFINDKSREIFVAAKNSNSFVIWNPGKDLASQINDFNDDGYNKMLCVEAANTANVKEIVFIAE